MRLVSKFHDYYDSALAQGVDTSIVYVRHESEPREVSLYDVLPERERVLFDKISNFFLSRLIIVAGKLYPVIELGVAPTNCIWYSSMDHIRTFPNWDKIKDKKQTRWWFTKYEELTVEERMEMLFSLSGFDVSDYCIENKLVVSVIKFQPKSNSISKMHIIDNPQLKEYNLQKALDPYTCMQEIMMWVSGVIGSPAGVMIEVRDIDKVVGKGFDKVYGFRTRPTKRKP